MANVDTTLSRGGMISSYVHLQVGHRNLGNTNLSDGNDPKVIKEFTITRAATTSDSDDGTTTPAFTAEFVLDSFIERDLPKYLIDFMRENKGRKHPPVTFKYGHVNGPGSPIYSGTISKLEFSSDLYTMTLTVVADGRDSSFSSYNTLTWRRVRKNRYKSVSRFVEDIAKSQNWDIGKIVPTKEFESKPIVIDDVSKSPIDFLTSKLKGPWKKYAISENGESNYALSFNQTRHGMKLFFVPTSFNKNSYDYRQLKSFNYFINLTPNNRVISFQPTITTGQAEAGMATDNSLKNMFGVITKDTKQFKKVAYEFGERSNRATLNPMDEVGGAFQSNPAMNPSYVDMSTMAESVIKNNINDYSFASISGTKATLTIIGDPEMQPLDHINVIPMMEMPPGTGASKSVMHPTGGTYLITSITDSISDQFTTEMELISGGQGKKFDIDKIAKANVKNSKR